MKNILFLLVCSALLYGCGVTRQTSKFSVDTIELGITKKDFLDKWGKPFSQDRLLTSSNDLEEKLYYNEKMYIGDWYIVTTAFTFRNSKLIKQEIVKEEKLFSTACECQSRAIDTVN